MNAECTNERKTTTANINLHTHTRTHTYNNKNSALLMCEHFDLVSCLREFSTLVCLRWVSCLVALLATMLNYLDLLQTAYIYKCTHWCMLECTCIWFYASIFMVSTRFFLLFFVLWFSFSISLNFEEKKRNLSDILFAYCSFHSFDVYSLLVRSHHQHGK